MPNILVLLACVSQYVEPTPLRQLDVRFINSLQSMKESG